MTSQKIKVSKPLVHSNRHLLLNILVSQSDVIFRKNANMVKPQLVQGFPGRINNYS